MNIVAISVNKKFRDKLKKQFSDYKINFIEPIKFSDITARQYFNHIKNQKTNLLMSPGELACLLSHRRALDLCVKSNYAKTLIIEEDIIGSNDDIKKIKKLSRLISGNSVLHLGGMDDLRSRHLLFGKRVNGQDYYSLHKNCLPFLYRSCAYLVTRSSAARIKYYYDRNMTTQLILADSWGLIAQETKIQVFISLLLKHPVDLSLSTLNSDRGNLYRISYGVKFLRKLKIAVFLLKTVFFYIQGYSRIFARNNR